LAFSPDSTHLATGADDRRINIYELASGEVTAFLTCPSWTLSLTFFGSHSVIASGHADSKVRVWDVEKKELLYTFNDHSDQVFIYLIFSYFHFFFGIFSAYSNQILGVGFGYTWRQAD
jgi:WD40 repeat protein